MTAQRHEPCPHWPKAQFALWWTASYFCTPLHSVSGSALFFLLIKGQEQGCWEWTEWGSFCALLERRTVEHFSWASTELCNSHPVQTLRGCLLPGRGCCCQSVFNEVELTSWASERNADHKDQRLCVPVVCLICLGVNCPARRVFLLIFEFFRIFVKYFLKPDPIIFFMQISCTPYSRTHSLTHYRSEIPISLHPACLCTARENQSTRRKPNDHRENTQTRDPEDANHCATSLPKYHLNDLKVV